MNNPKVQVTLNIHEPEKVIQGIYLDLIVEEDVNETQALIGTRFGILRVDIDDPNAEIAFVEVNPPLEIPTRILPAKQGPVGTVAAHLEQMRQSIEVLLNVFEADPEELNRVQEAELQRIEAGIDRLRMRAKALGGHP